MPGSWLATAAVVGVGLGAGVGVGGAIVALDDSCPECSAARGCADPDMQPLNSARAAPTAATTMVRLGLTRAPLPPDGAEPTASVTSPGDVGAVKTCSTALCSVPRRRGRP